MRIAIKTCSIIAVAPANAFLVCLVSIYDFHNLSAQSWTDKIFAGAQQHENPSQPQDRIAATHVFGWQGTSFGPGHWFHWFNAGMTRYKSEKWAFRTIELDNRSALMKQQHCGHANNAEFRIEAGKLQGINGGKCQIRKEAWQHIGIGGKVWITRTAIGEEEHKDTGTRFSALCGFANWLQQCHNILDAGHQTQFIHWIGISIARFFWWI